MKKSVSAFSVGLCLLFVAGCDDEGGGDKGVDGGGNAAADGGGNVVVDGGNTVPTSDAGSGSSDAYVPPIVPGGGIVCTPAATSFPGPDGGVMDGAARICYFMQTSTSTPVCTVLRDVAGNRMSCNGSTTGVDLIGVGPELGKSTWRAKTKTNDPPQRIRSASHGVIDNNIFGGEVSGLPTGTEITLTLQPSAYWTALGPDDYVVKLRIDGATVTIISVGRAPAPKAQ
jgi:hypothetical protein